jgi:hypothetical protein
MPKPASAEILTIDELAERLKLSRALVFEWVNRGILVQGKHFFKFGRVVRFVYSDNMLELLLNASGVEENHSTTKSVIVPARPTKPSPVNWEY